MAKRFKDRLTQAESDLEHARKSLIRELPQNKVKIAKELLQKAVYLDKLYIPTKLN